MTNWVTISGLPLRRSPGGHSIRTLTFAVAPQDCVGFVLTALLCDSIISRAVYSFQFFPICSGHQALKISDFLSPHTFKKKEIFNEFYNPMRIPFTMGIALPVNRRCLVTIGSHRDRKDFTERERTALNMIQPHVLQAYANAQAVTHMQTELLGSITQWSRSRRASAQLTLEVSSYGRRLVVGSWSAIISEH